MGALTVQVILHSGMRALFRDIVPGIRYQAERNGVRLSIDSQFPAA